MDVLIQASDTEGTPRSVLEAMAHHTIEIMRCRVNEAYRRAYLRYGHGPRP